MLEIESITAGLQVEFALRDLGSLNYFLGIDVQYMPSRGLFLSQCKYFLDLLDKASMSDDKPTITPMFLDTKLTAYKWDLFPKLALYWSIVKSLQYATLTCPDLSFTIKKVC